MAPQRPTAPVRTRVLALALVGLVLAVYAPVRAHEFVSYDDPVYLTENPHLGRGLDWDEVRWFFTHEYAANYHPLTWLSHLLDVQLFGLDPAGHHLVSVALHALNAVLVFLLLRRLLGAGQRREPLAALGAALFALHPLRVESVAWASERKDLLCALFFLLALLAYLRHAERPGPWRYAAVLLATALALLAKPMAVTLPCVMVLLDLWPLRRLRFCGLGERAPAPPSPAPTHPGETHGDRRGHAVWLEKLPLLALVLLAALATWLAQRRAGSASDLASLGLDLRLLNGLAAVGVYLRQTLWPAGLAVFYPHAAILSPTPRSALLLPAALGLGAALALLVLTWRLRRTRPLAWVGLLWFLGTLAPVLGVVQVGTQAHADRYTYLPAVGLSLLLAGLACGPDPAMREPIVRVPWLTAGLALSLALALVTRQQLHTWSDSATLFRHADAVVEDNYLARLKLGELVLDEGELVEAER